MVKMGTVWERTAEFLTDNLAAIVPIALFAFFVPFSIQGNLAQVRVGASPTLGIVLTLISLAFSLLTLWGWLALVAMAAGVGDERSAGTTGARRLLPVVVVWTAVFLVVVALPALAITLVSGADGESALREVVSAANGGAIVETVRRGVILYVVLIALPLLWLGARLILVTPVIVSEARWFGAIARSFALTRGHTLTIVGVMILYFLVSMVASLATNVVFGSIFELIAGQPQSGMSLSNVLTSVMVAVVMAGFEVIGALFTAKLYLALVAERNRATGA